MSGRGTVAKAARLLCAAAALPLASTALAQTPPQQPSGPQPPDTGELDPSAPLAPLPDLGVAWPDLNAKDTNVPEQTPTPAPVTTESASEVRYTWAIEGLGSIGNSEELLKSFRQQSAL